MTKQKLLDILGYILFLLFFTIMLLPMMIGGAVRTPIRYYKFIKAGVNDKVPDKYYY